MAAVARSDSESTTKFDAYLVNPTAPRDHNELCCCPKLLVEHYFRRQLSDRSVHREVNTSRGQSSVIVHVEDPFPEIISAIGQASSNEVDPTVSGVIKILTYRVWRGLVQQAVV